MVTLFASIAGFLSSILPEIFRFFKDSQDKKHEIELLQIQMEYSRTAHTHQLEAIEMQRDALEHHHLYSTYNAGVYWVDALNATVRPVLAYSFFIMYGAVKFLQLRYIAANSELVAYLDVLWNQDDQAIFAGIISFYFGQRTFSKFWRRFY